MPRIMTNCPASSQLVPTGHRTANLRIDTMIGSRSFRCPACSQVHAWTAPEAVVETAELFR